MVNPNNINHEGCGNRGADRQMPYESPYVEISGDVFHSNSSNSSVYEGRGSVNSFLEEAEIISNDNITTASREMRKKLTSFYMNPIEKWKQRGRFPWKLCVQVVNIVLATIQVNLFGFHSFGYMQQHIDMTTAISRILLKDWNADVAVYPPNGPYAVYTVPDFYDHIDNVIKQYTKIDSLAIGPFGYDNNDNNLTAMDFCVSQYDGQVFAANLTIQVIDLLEERCVAIPPLYPSGDPQWENFSMSSFLEQSNHTLNFKTLINAKLKLKLKTIFIKSLNKLDFPECYRLKLLVKYDNTEHDGQLVIKLTIRSTKFSCHVNSKIEDQGETMYYMLRQLLNSFVIIFSVVSAILCARSLYAGYKLAKETYNFFKQYYQKEISFCELLDFIDFWYVNIIVSDILLISGSLVKMQIEERSAEGREYARCSILLGVGNLFIWIGILRYLGFFPKYNMLILTVKRALPNVLRFLVCAVLLFVGSCFCSWIVLSPYHIKFRTLSRTAECLFSIMNGDDMFATFALLDTQLNLIWWFSRLFLYAFLVIFIYIVVSLFISVIMDTFETIKHIYVYGAPPRTTVETFLASEPLPPLNPLSFPSENSVNHFMQFWNWLRHTWSVYRDRGRL
ncbi:Mucolipin-3 [Araneus ventricosus]|uniref:Mucolipin-3 n=1 Tax=Araneus ventricosus TaxID=182803 RepID=A0A4Y2TZ65_ARAVE|nr:Mucolipin-3 [Araneus ventricosus]